MGLASVRALRGKNMRLGGGDDELTALFVVHYTGAVFRNKCALWWCSFLFSFFLSCLRPVGELLCLLGSRGVVSAPCGL